MQSPNPTIPVIIDSIKRSGAPLTRCSYFSIECDEPAADWNLTIEDKSYPFLMLGLSGVIYAAADGGPFTSPRKIEDLFGGVENDPRLFVDSHDIWLPSGLFENFGVGIFARQSLFRIGLELFRLALEHRNSRLTTDHFINRALGLAAENSGSKRGGSEAVAYSETETLAFKTWVQSIISETRDLKSFAPRLPRKSTSQDTQP